MLTQTWPPQSSRGSSAAGSLTQFVFFLDSHVRFSPGTVPEISLLLSGTSILRSNALELEGKRVSFVRYVNAYLTVTYLDS